MANYVPMVTRGAYTIGPNTTASAVDDPDQMFYEEYTCGSENNVTK
jgi:peptide/nickel transport system substrate-binding protein